MAQFSIFFPLLAHNEGGYVSPEEAEKKHDSGGETYKGIARAKHPDWKGWGIIDSYKPQATFPRVLDNDHTLQDLILSFYKGEFWDVLSGDAILNQSIANFMADWGANAGPSVPIKHVQKVLGFEGIDQDGKMGPKTLAALNVSSNADFFAKLKAERITFYRDVVEAHPEDAGFLDGWIARTNHFVYA